MAGRSATSVAFARFLVFVALFLSIVGVILVSRSLLIAPPYAVTAFLIVFDRDGKYAQPKSIVTSYLVVIGSSELFVLTLGITYLALVLNVIVVSALIAFTSFAHPPALALTIFSYIAHDSVVFSLTSLVVLGIVVGADLIVHRNATLSRWLGGAAPDTT